MALLERKKVSADGCRDQPTKISHLVNDEENAGHQALGGKREVTGVEGKRVSYGVLKRGIFGVTKLDPRFLALPLSTC